MPNLNLDLPITLDDEMSSVAREIAMRKRNYPRWIESGRLMKHIADREIAAMEAVLQRLKGIKDGNKS